MSASVEQPAGADYRGNAEECAAAKGQVIVTPGPKELFLDIDDEASLAAFWNSRSVLGGLIESVRMAPSPSNKPHRFHITLTLVRPVRDAFERIGLQAILGSDRLHESLSWRAAERGIQSPTVFFEKP